MIDLDNHRTSDYIVRCLASILLQICSRRKKFQLLENNSFNFTIKNNRIIVSIFPPFAGCGVGGSFVGPRSKLLGAAN
jgi:hypothetical protein